MTDTKTIEEGNRIIAKFDGWKLRKKPFVNSDNEKFPYWEKFEDGNVIKTYHHDILNAKGRFEYRSYHSSWDWLFPACRKFKDLDLDNDLYRSHMDAVDSSIIDEYDINQAWTALVDAIHWYNKTLQDNG